MKNYWNLSLGLSVLAHAFVIAGIPSFEQSRLAKKEEEFRELEINASDSKELLKRNNDFLKSSPPLPYIENIKPNQLRAAIDASLSDKAKIMESNLKEVILSEMPQQKDLKKLPAYMDYYRLIRERIKKNAYRNYYNNERGEVFLSFIISKDGRLDNAYLNKESAENPNLRTVALKSVKDSSPFPSFPEELSNYENLQFNISIYFKSN